jgi:light-regulated signal transduction histidine kinase (bacteriophytochrome)
LFRRKAAPVLDENCLGYLDRMASAAARMQTLIEGPLTYSRVTSKAATLEPVDLNAVL